MKTAIRTVVTFKSSAFNTSKRREYFINPGCFGDDLAKWLGEQLRSKGYQAADLASQEDFGWHLTFAVSGVEHCLVIAHRPGNEEDEGLWVGWLERSRGLVASVLGRRQWDIQPSAARAIHEILSSSPQIQNILWYLKRDFDNGREELGTPIPSD